MLKNREFELSNFEALTIQPNNMSISEKDFQYIWHPYTHQKNRLPSIPIVKGKKTVLFDEAGNKYIDAISSWWVNIHGHGNKYIAKQLYNQAKKLQQVIFAGFTHEPAVALAEKLLKVLPGDFSKIFYSDNGSTATEVAIKMSLQYWMNNGEGTRNKILAFGPQGFRAGFITFGERQHGFYSVDVGLSRVQNGLVTLHVGVVNQGIDLGHQIPFFHPLVEVDV